MKKLTFFKSKKQKHMYGDMEEDGGVEKKVVINAPKHIQSTLIIRFSVEMSTVAAAKENEYCGYVYNLKAALENGAVKGSYKCRDRYGSVFEQRFRESVKFMSDLNRIVTEYDLAKYNGESCLVAGLPDNYGASVNITFASGEHLYASNNQSNFIPDNAVKEMVELFESRAISVSNWTKMDLSYNNSKCDSCLYVRVKREGTNDMFAEGYLVSKGEEYSFDEEFCMSAEAVGAINNLKLSSLPKAGQLPEILHTDDDSEQKLILCYNCKEVAKELDNKTLARIYDILLGEFIRHQEELDLS
ncbi:MAG: hypothetical protein IJC76_03745 [Lachnospiraceae bacterium]|nr:hypothetical protein [Lachnospiraceae bacterium]